jgi:hypothetical protein
MKFKIKTRYNVKSRDGRLLDFDDNRIMALKRVTDFLNVELKPGGAGQEYVDSLMPIRVEKQETKIPCIQP